MSDREKSKPTQGSRRRPPVGLIVGLPLVVFGIWWIFFSERGPGDRNVHSSKPEAEYGRLVGKWLRPDGGYVLHIRGATTDGKLDAQYLNPQPINVAKAQATMEGGTMKVLVELRDTNYPGSIYSLSYDPESDRLHGGYYQAALQETYAVVFERTD